FVIFSVCLFYSFATVNGTLEKLAEHLIYQCRTVPQLLPFAVFFTATAISAMGAGYYTVLAFMAPITLLLCQRTGMSLITGGMAVNYGALSGANFVSSQSGIIFRGLMVNAGIPENEAFINAAGIFVSTPGDSAGGDFRAGVHDRAWQGDEGLGLRGDRADAAQPRTEDDPVADPADDGHRAGGTYRQSHPAGQRHGQLYQREDGHRPDCQPVLGHRAAAEAGQ